MSLKASKNPHVHWFKAEKSLDYPNQLFTNCHQISEKAFHRDGPKKHFCEAKQAPGKFRKDVGIVYKGRCPLFLAAIEQWSDTYDYKDVTSWEKT